MAENIVIGPDGVIKRKEIDKIEDPKPTPPDIPIFQPPKGNEKNNREELIAGLVNAGQEYKKAKIRQMQITPENNSAKGEKGPEI